MTSMTAVAPTTTKPAVTHPNWCDPDQCSEDRSHGTLRAVNHRSPLSELTLTSPGAENSTLRIRAWLTQFDDYDEASVTRSAAVPYLDADGDADVSIDQLEQAGRWFTEMVRVYRAAAECADVATVDGATERTVLAEDDGKIVLAVDNDADELVYLEGDMPIDRYVFSPKEAREFAYALLAHAARVEAGR